MERETNTPATVIDSKSETNNGSKKIAEKLTEEGINPNNVVKDLSSKKGDDLNNPDKGSEGKKTESLQTQKNPTIESKINSNKSESSIQVKNNSMKRKRDTESDLKLKTGSNQKVDNKSDDTPMKTSDELNQTNCEKSSIEKSDTITARKPADVTNKNPIADKTTISNTPTSNPATIANKPNISTSESKTVATDTNATLKTVNKPKTQAQQKELQNDKNNLQKTNETTKIVNNGVHNDTNSHNKKDNINEVNHFVPLHYFGKHNKAVSAVAFAPTSPYSPWTYDYTSKNSLFMDDYRNSSETGFRREKSYAICASSSADGTVKVWNITNDMVAEVHEAQNTNKSKKEKQTVSESSNGSFPASQQMTPLSNLVGHSRGINDLAWSRTAEYIATASDDKTIRLWDVSTSDALVEFKGHTNFVFALNFNPQSNLLVSGSFDETVKIWDIRSGGCVSTIPAHSDPVTAVDFNRDGTCIVSGSHDGLIRVWDTATGECLKTIYADGNPPVGYVKFSPNGKFVLAGTLDSKLRLWQIASKTTPRGNPNAPTTSDSASTATRSSSGKPQMNNIKNYDILTKAGLHNKNAGGGKCTKTYSGHVNLKYCTFSTFCVANSSRESIVSGSEDGNIFLYDLQSRQIRQVLKGHEDAVLAVAAHDKKEILASGGMTIDRTVRFWVPSSSHNDSSSVGKESKG